MVACVDGAADVHASANGPELLEVGVVAFDRGSVRALLLPDLVCAAVALVASILCCTDIVGWVVVTHCFDDIVLNERIIRPAVEREICSAIGFECTSVVHQHVSRWLIASTNDKVSAGTIIPVGGEQTVGTSLEVDSCKVVRPILDRVQWIVAALTLFQSTPGLNQACSGA